MSHIRVKTKYKEEGSYGAHDEHTLYAHHNLSADIVIVYDEDFHSLFSFTDTIDNNMLDGIIRVAEGWIDANAGNLLEGLEYMSNEEVKKMEDSLWAYNDKLNRAIRLLKRLVNDGLDDEEAKSIILEK